MGITTKLTRVGDSLYVLIPAFIVRDFNLQENDEVEVEFANDTWLIKIKKGANKRALR